MYYQKHDGYKPWSTIYRQKSVLLSFRQSYTITERNQVKESSEMKFTAYFNCESQASFKLVHHLHCKWNGFQVPVKKKQIISLAKLKHNLFVVWLYCICIH